MKGKRLRAMFVMLHRARMTRSLAENLIFPWDGPRLTTRGTPVDPTAIATLIENAVSGKVPVLNMVPPRRAVDEKRFPGAPLYILFLDRADELELSTDPEVIFTYRVLAALTPPYATLFANDTNNADLASGEGSARFLDACERTARTLDAHFAFGDEDGVFMDPDLADARTRAWGLAYYGPEMSERIGRERLRSAPAHRVTEERGGFWVQLDELPFAPSKRKEERRAALEEHLGLGKLFGPPQG